MQLTTIINFDVSMKLGLSHNCRNMTKDARG